MTKAKHKLRSSEMIEKIIEETDVPDRLLLRKRLSVLRNAVHTEILSRTKYHLSHDRPLNELSNPYL